MLHNMFIITIFSLIFPIISLCIKAQDRLTVCLVSRLLGALPLPLSALVIHLPAVVQWLRPPLHGLRSGTSGGVLHVVSSCRFTHMQVEFIQLVGSSSSSSDTQWPRLNNLTCTKGHIRPLTPNRQMLTAETKSADSQGSLKEKKNHLI